MKLIFSVIGALLLLSCEEKPVRDDYISMMRGGEVAVQLLLPDTGLSLLETIKVSQPISHSYYIHTKSIYQFLNYSITIEMYDGITIWDSITKKKYFLKIIGALNADISKPPFLRINSSIGTATFLAIGNDTLKPISFIFNYPGTPPPISQYILFSIKEPKLDEYGRYSMWESSKYYFECPDQTKVVYGWDVSSTAKGYCYGYFP